MLTQFAVSIMIDENVTRLDISMNLPLRVQIFQSVETLFEHDGDLLLGQRALADGHQIAQGTSAAEFLDTRKNQAEGSGTAG